MPWELRADELVADCRCCDYDTSNAVQMLTVAGVVHIRNCVDVALIDECRHKFVKNFAELEHMLHALDVDQTSVRRLVHLPWHCVHLRGKA